MKGKVLNLMMMGVRFWGRWAEATLVDVEGKGDLKC